MGFGGRAGGFLPGDWVDEGKLLLFMKEEVVNRAPQVGKRLKEEKKRRMVKRRKLDEPSAAGPQELPLEGEDDELQSDLVLMYNSMRSYVSAIMELWAHQTSRKLHNAPAPHRVALKALETSIARGEHAHHRRELQDCGLMTIRDGYTERQIATLMGAAWACGGGGGGAVEIGRASWRER